MNDVCRLLDLRYPIIQGGMGNISNAELASAVSEAGGLGTIGAGTMPPDEVEALIVETKRRTDRPFAVNIPLQVTPHTTEVAELVIQHHVPVVSLSAGNPAPWIPRFAEHGIKVIVVVASASQAKKAEAAGADLVVAEGYEAAGINSPLELTTMTLIPQVASAVRIPVVAAGGIGDGRGLLAAFALGAQGVQLGTRLVATKEAPFHEAYKQRLVEAKENETIIVGRSVGRIRRVVRIPYTEKLLEYEQQGMPLEQFQAYTSEDRHRRGALLGDFHEGFINAGQIAGLIDDVPTVAELFEQMMMEAKTQWQSLSEQFR
ncbi:2-nitropropane dioxygenase [Geobacillus genomosp. 3]|uniref:Probable nitronate monooxygenase n=2 Tax=Anoxybacillaceae TaxID=3120669 RepID=S5ZPH0_GEOG3|nr:nitronate monooxygenase [Geobacillus genomosp. 3]AGT32343.1 2-nitropropane dioxygenase [Geobacillus genomosp. 3]